MRYVNQAKATCAHGKVLKDWEDVCAGHDTYEEADACQEAMKTALEGKPIPPEYGANEETMMLLSMFGKLSEVMAIKNCWRIVKRTDEVVHEEV